MNQTQFGGRAIGVDIGGTHLRAGVVDANGSVIARRHVPTPQESGSAVLIAQIGTIVTELYAESGVVPIGVGVAGVVSADGTLNYGPNLAMRDAAIGPQLRERFNVAVIVVNDATAAAFGEQRAGGAQGVSDMLLVTVGTGIGGGIVIGGTPVLGAHAMAAELGHVVVVPGGRMCGCGGRGCVEAYASGTALSAIANEQRANFTTDRLNGATSINGSLLVHAANSGDELADRILVDATRYLGQAIATATNLLDPEHVAVGGGLAQPLWPWIRREVPAALINHVFAATRRELPAVALTELDDDAGIVGAALMAQEIAAADRR